MSEAIPPLTQYAFMAWCSVKKAQGQLYLYLYILLLHKLKNNYAAVLYFLVPPKQNDFLLIKTISLIIT
jgi:hypothetical protein